MQYFTGKCVIVCAPSGAGKTTIVRHLLKVIPELSFSISATSRPPRHDEKEGVDYYFLSAEQFRTGIDLGNFLEWEEVYSGQFYGTLKKEIRRIWSENRHVIFDVDVVGGVNLKSYFASKALAIFVKPPDLNTLETRLKKRKTESTLSLKKRLEKAGYEMTFADKFDRVLVNDDLTDACAQAEAWVKQFLEK